MNESRAAKLFVIVVAFALVAGAMVAPAAAKKKSAKGGSGVSCPKFKPTVAGAESAKVMTVTDSATEDDPLTIDLTHAMAVPLPSSPAPLGEDAQFFNIQVAPKDSSIGLFMRETFDDTSDIDLYVYDEAGQTVAQSAVFNPVPQGPLGGPTGGTGYESVPGVHVNRCQGFTIESRATLTQGSPATITVWLGKHAG